MSLIPAIYILESSGSVSRISVSLSRIDHQLNPCRCVDNQTRLKTLSAFIIISRTPCWAFWPIRKTLNSACKIAGADVISPIVGPAPLPRRRELISSSPKWLPSMCRMKQQPFWHHCFSQCRVTQNGLS